LKSIPLNQSITRSFGDKKILLKKYQIIDEKIHLSSGMVSKPASLDIPI